MDEIIDPLFEEVGALAAIIARAENCGMKEAEVDIIHSKLSSGAMSFARAEEIIQAAEAGENVSKMLNGTDSL